MSKRDFQDGGCGSQLGFLIVIGTIIAEFDIDVVPSLQCKFWLKINQRIGKRCQKLIFTMVAVAAIMDFGSAQF